jgi:hypothetical protein
MGGEVMGWWKNHQRTSPTTNIQFLYALPTSAEGIDYLFSAIHRCREDGMRLPPMAAR